MIVNGWAGKILRIDLDHLKVTKELSSKYLKYTGGIGFGFKVIFDEAPVADPFDPENRLVFAVGPLTGTLAPSSGRSEVISISPHVYASGARHSLVTRSGFGGYWGAELKFAGYDAVIIQGKAPGPVYVSVYNDKVAIKDAKGLWGLDAIDTQKRIKKILNDQKVQIVTIGPAGENMVRIAPIIHRTGNAAGQGGFGGVMGSKNLKAIVVRGTHGVKTADEKGTIKFARDIRKILPAGLGSTPAAKKAFVWDKYIDPENINKQSLRVNQTHTMAPALAKYHVKHVACYACPVACYSYIRVPGMGAGAMGCTQFFYAWAGNRDATTFLANQLANRLGINTYEMVPLIQFIWYLQDTSVNGKSILQYMSDEALVTDKIKRGLDSIHYPPKGKVGPEAIEMLMNMIAYRQGFLGECFGEGFRRAMDRVAGEFEKRGLIEVAARIMEFENMEGIVDSASGGNGGRGMSGHYDPRALGYYWAVNFSMENRDPNRHALISLLKWSGLGFEQSLPIAESILGKEIAENGLSDVHRDRTAALTWNGVKSAHANAVIARFIHYRGCIKDSLTVCDWVYPVMTSARKERQYAGDTSFEYRLFSYITGEKINQAELDKRAARIWNMHRLLTALEWGGGKPVNLKEDHDQIPDHYFLPLKERLLSPFDPIRGEDYPPLDRKMFEMTKVEYYRIMGWDEETGLPRRATLEALDMKDEADRFETIGFNLPE